jgi:hypothetical protein
MDHSALGGRRIKRTMGFQFRCHATAELTLQHFARPVPSTVAHACSADKRSVPRDGKRSAEVRHFFSKLGFSLTAG